MKHAQFCTTYECPNSASLFQKASRLLVGGVDSPVRAFKAVGQTPLFIKKAYQAYLYTEDDQQLVDYVLSWGALLLGHAHPHVTAAISQTAAKGISFGAPSKLEIELAELVQHFYPSCERIRFVNSGTESTMAALRLARAWKKRNKIIKFKGCYHGHSDSLLVQAGSGALTFNMPNSEGVPKEFVQHTLLADFNDIRAVEKLFIDHPDDIAGIIVEPIPGNMGLVLPHKDFLERLRYLCSLHDSVLIFDEVMSGFRVDLGGAQALYCIQPDLTCLGKVIGGGLPCGAVGGRAEIMNQLAPVGKVYQAGTLSGNPVTMAAGIASLNLLKNDPQLFEIAKNRTTDLAKGMKAIIEKRGFTFQIQAIGTMFTLYFTSQPIHNLNDTQTCRTDVFALFFHEMLKRGIYFAPSQFEANFMSIQHTEQDIQRTLEVFHDVMNLESFLHWR